MLFSGAQSVAAPCQAGAVAVGQKKLAFTASKSFPPAPLAPPGGGVGAASAASSGEGGNDAKKRKISN